MDLLSVTFLMKRKTLAFFSGGNLPFRRLALKVICSVGKP